MNAMEVHTEDSDVKVVKQYNKTNKEEEKVCQQHAATYQYKPPPRTVIEESQR